MEQSGSPTVAQLGAELAAARHALARTEDLLRKSRDREAMLAAELQHRIRNMLAIIRSVFARTAETGTSLDDAADHFRGRLDTIARHHMQMIREPGVALDLETMVRDELLNFGFGDGPQVAIKGPRVLLPDSVAGMLGLAFHELATNAIKFGALATDKAQLAVRWTLRVEPEGARASIEWIETGVPVIASAPMHTGFGREFIEQALPYQLDAVTSLELRPGGVACRIDVPLGAGGKHR